MKKPIGTLLVEAGLIGPDHLEAALEEHRATGVRLGAVLVRRGLVSEARLTQVLSYQLGLPWVTLGTMAPAQELLEAVPSDVAAQYRLVPVHLRHGRDGSVTLYVATDDPTNTEGLEECAARTGLNVRPMVAAPADVSEALLEHYGIAPTVIPPPDDLDLEELPDEDLALDDEPRGALASHVTQYPEKRASDVPDIDLGAALALSAQERRSVGTESRPVFVVGAKPEQVAQFRQTLAQQRIAVVVVALRELAERIREQRPLALLVMEEIYAFDRVSFSRLSVESHVPLVVWSDELEVDFLEAVLQTARR